MWGRRIAWEERGDPTILESNSGEMGLWLERFMAYIINDKSRKIKGQKIVKTSRVSTLERDALTDLFILMTTSVSLTIVGPILKAMSIIKLDENHIEHGRGKMVP